MARAIGSARLTYRHDVTDTLAILRFGIDGGVPEFQPGQFLTIGLPVEAEGGKVIWRAYSIASPPHLRDHVELYVRRPLDPVPGRVTSALWALPVGGELQHRGVTGAFTIERTLPGGEPDVRRLLLVGSGTGVAPFVSYASSLEHEDAARDVVLLHGASHAVELAYDEALRALEARTRGSARFRFRYVPTISRPTDPRNAGWTGETGRVESLLEPLAGGRSRVEQMLGVDLTPETFFCHACGYDGSVKAALAALEPKGFRTWRHRRDDGRFDVKVESYG